MTPRRPPHRLLPALRGNDAVDPHELVLHRHRLHAPLSSHRDGFFAFPPVDAQSLHHLLGQGGDPPHRRQVVLRLPDLRDAQAPADREPRHLLLCAEDGQQVQRRALPDEPHDIVGRAHLASSPAAPEGVAQRLHGDDAARRDRTHAHPPHPQVHPIEEDSPLYPALAVLSDLSTPSEDLSTASSRRLSRCFTSSHLDPGRVGARPLSDA